jgi:hypothetical protein
MKTKKMCAEPELSYEEILALLGGEPEPEPAPEPDEPSVLTPEERETQESLTWWMNQIK